MLFSSVALFDASSADCEGSAYVRQSKRNALMTEFSGVSGTVEYLVREGRLQEAIPYAERSVNLCEVLRRRDQPQTRLGYSNTPECHEEIGTLAYLHEQLGDNDEAEALYQRSLAIAPSFATAIEGMAQVYVNRGDYRAAEKLLKRGIERFWYPAQGKAICEVSLSALYERARFIALPGTAAEGTALGALLPGAHVLTGARATESELKQVRGPSLLHIATHGFFLNDQPARTESVRGLLLLEATPTARQASIIENPLLRSSLVFAGANEFRSGQDDGILTALEASALDLEGTSLVVLSACETGVGEVRNGEGVYGLRRAFVMAGSESQLMSLWKVSDEATRDLMIGFYDRMLQGKGRLFGSRCYSRMKRNGGSSANCHRIRASLFLPFRTESHHS